MSETVSARVAARWSWLLVLVLVLLPRLASAGQPVIAPGREDEILGLFAPYEFGDELAPGWSLRSFSVDRGSIVVQVLGPERAVAQLRLEHPDYGPPGALALTGFAVLTTQPPGSEAAVAALIAAIERNDQGKFWSREVVYAEAQEEPERVGWSELSLQLARAGERALEWARDGLVLLALLTIVLLALVADKLRGAEPWMKWTLLAIVVAGAALRLTLSPAVALAPWAYTRTLISAQLIYGGPGLAALHPGPAWLSEVILTSTLVLSLLAPLAVYVHARYLLDDHRAALIVAGVLAFLPLHLRFSHSDAAFIPSITVSSTVFALIHAATRDPSKRRGWLAIALLGFPLALVYLVRPLNILYFPLLLATAFVDQGIYSSKPRADRVRVGAAFVVVTLVSVFGGIRWLLDSFGDNVREGLSFETLIAGIGLLFSPRMNILLNPVFTPPLLTVVAVVGAVDLWRRGQRALLGFLLAWLLGFLLAHAYVVPGSVYMQARYHLHLIVPYMLLVACGIEAVLTWIARKREARAWLSGRRAQAAIAGMIAYVVASPLIHLHAVRFVGLNDPSEWLFVHGLREQIPADCAVIEYTGTATDSRFTRVGAYVSEGVASARWQVHPFAESPPGEPELPADIRALLEDPPECLVWYEGLPCFGNAPVPGTEAPACEAIVGFVELEPIAATELRSRPYDSDLAHGLGERERIPLSLYRARPRASE